MKEETLKSDMASGTTNDFELIGDRVLILLDEAKDHTQTESGLFIPLNQLQETDGGRVTTKLSSRKHLLRGTIIKISAQASKKLEELGVSLAPGDRVLTSGQVLNTNSYQFFHDRDKLVLDFDGHVCIPHILIEAKITTPQ